jgi:hypothetical protein
VFCASLLASGCGGSEGPADGSRGTGATGGVAALEPYFHAGTRLKPMVVSVSPGIDIIDRTPDFGWFDSELDMNCYFLPDDDGVERCFPSRNTSGNTYVDASCTRPALPIGSGGRCDSWVSERVVLRSPPQEGCGYRAYHVVAELPVSTPLFFWNGVACEPNPAVLPSDDHLYELDALPADTFVGMRRRHEARLGRMDAHIREGEDGSWQVIGFFDTKRDRPCFDARLGAGHGTKCVPRKAVWDGAYRDAACQERVTEVPWTCGNEAPSLIVDVRLDDPNACAPSAILDLFEIDGTAQTNRYLKESGVTCVEFPFTPGESSMVYLEGARVDPATLPTTELVDVGGGAVRSRFLGFGGIPYIPYVAEPFVDAASGESCELRAFADGAVRCVPSSVIRTPSGSVAYEGSSCDGARLLGWSGCPGEPKPRAVLLYTVGECGASQIMETYALAGATSATTVSYLDPTSSTCVSIDRATDTSTFFRFGEPLNPPDVFPAVERVIRD